MFDEFEEKENEQIGVRFYILVACGFVLFLGMALVALNFAGVISFSSARSSNPSEPAKAGVTSKNKEHARAALNAIGEMNSVASVGSNYMQYTSAMQSARIKFDAALRDFESPTPEELALVDELEEAFQCYMDASSAWSEFIKDGDSYGFLKARPYSQLPTWEKQYKFKPGKDGEYFKEEVIGAMLRAGGLSFAALSQKIKN